MCDTYGVIKTKCQYKFIKCDVCWAWREMETERHDKKSAIISRNWQLVVNVAIGCIHREWSKWRKKNEEPASTIYLCCATMGSAICCCCCFFVHFHRGKQRTLQTKFIYLLNAINSIAVFSCIFVGCVRVCDSLHVFRNIFLCVWRLTSDDCAHSTMNWWMNWCHCLSAHKH